MLGAVTPGGSVSRFWGRESKEIKRINLSGNYIGLGLNIGPLSLHWHCVAHRWPLGES